VIPGRADSSSTVAKATGNKISERRSRAGPAADRGQPRTCYRDWNGRQPCGRRSIGPGLVVASCSGPRVDVGMPVPTSTPNPRARARHRPARQRRTDRPGPGRPPARVLAALDGAETEFQPEDNPHLTEHTTSLARAAPAQDTSRARATATLDRSLRCSLQATLVPACSSQLPGCCDWVGTHLQRPRRARRRITRAFHATLPAAVLVGS
jgi:hypothetical protein